MLFSSSRGTQILLRKTRRIEMINFEEELEKYEPSPDVEQVENIVNNNNLTDVTDIVRELIADARTTASL